ncbi:MAG: cytidylate kinase-like family protein [Lachnospiraceae bacterium]|nr:cytidylate kinase-like family protein [Lachnospiraceae bacterium]
MDGRIIVTIGRESGSGGRKIGLALAEALGVECYDKELIKVAARESGLCEDILETHDEVPTRSFLYSLVMDTYSMSYHAGQVDMPMEQKVFLAQYNTIKAIAERESCVFVGRCADYALEGDPDVVSVFITGETEEKIQHISETYELSYDKAKDYMIKADKRRSNYYNYYSNKRWGEAQSYDLCLNRSKLGFKGTVQAIIEFARIRKQHQQELEKK